MKKRIINIDDFALNHAVDDAVFSLSEKNIIQSTSCMTLSPTWQTAAQRLHSHQIQAGLHLDMTSGFAWQAGYGMPLNKLIAQSYCRKLDQNKIQSIIYQQLDKFEDAYQAKPVFIDGHQHIHQLPQIRENLIEIVVKRYGQQTNKQLPYIRNCMAKSWRGSKAWLISQLGSAATHSLCQQHHITQNTDFAGVYNFAPHANLTQLWQQWLESLTGDFTIIMAHAATQWCEHDEIATARVHEFNFLNSEKFNELQNKMTLPSQNLT